MAKKTKTIFAQIASLAVAFTLTLGVTAISVTQYIN